MKLKFSKYCIAVNNNKGGITLALLGTNKYVIINDKQSIEKFKNYYENDNQELLINDSMIKKLYENGYVIDANIDEYKQINNQIFDYYKKCERNLMLTLYVTEQCNFRCIYCPEIHTTKKLAKTKWNALYKYLSYSVKNELYDKISISFFGGEPLLEISNIINFLSKLKIFCKNNKKIILEHQITTNGYLLTPEVYDKLVKLDVKSYQITLDGFAETHNRMRKMLNNNSSWQTIVNNLIYINSVNDDAKITLRTNYNRINLNTLKSFNDWELNTFNNKKFKFLYHPVTDFSKNVDKSTFGDNLSDNEEKIINEVYNFDSSRKDYTLTPYMEFLGLRCKAAEPSFYTISTDGMVSKCENITVQYKEAFIGELKDNGELIFNSNKQAWTENFETDNCRKCVYFPLCAGRACPAKKVLYPDRQYDCLLFYDETHDKIIKFLRNLC